MVTVTACTPVEKGRLCVCFDNGTELILYRTEARRFGLREEYTVTDAVFQELLFDVVGKRAKKRAMHLLEQMDRTEQQLREKLKQGGYPQVCIDEALDYVKSYHYVDDYRYACTYIRYRQERMSRQQLKVKLAQKGVPGDLMQQALDECYEGDEDGQIKQLLEKRRFDPAHADRKEFNRTYQYLMRRGFPGSAILRAMKSRQ